MPLCRSPPYRVRGRLHRDSGVSPAGRKVARIRTVLRNVHQRIGQKFQNSPLRNGNNPSLVGGGVGKCRRAKDGAAAILGLHPSTLRTRMHKLGMVRPETKNQIRLSTSFQSIPQYVEVPLNIEAKRIISYFSAVLSYRSNLLLLKDDFTLLIFFRLLASLLQIRSS